ncbi:phosphotransferase [Catenulispora sp. NF23]|uniref:Phosphotransferase n=1 Tax=Catenulispora pinistramenti TaxID=2705254 RepID=A0ABS5KR82_9ACTN|nr:phosphotransferase [Catenulispora pinistramenti]MBS2533129.1 phosphotransferase [Catenulispora pinistramenti]MBS2548542.1 phosphotransferase [Catenulispora pinistramenti]
MAMTHTDWSDLPQPLRDAVEAKAGRVVSARTVAAGLNSQIAAVLDTADGRVFLKGVPLEARTALASQRREAAINQFVLAVSPQLLWSAETEGWSLLAFEYIGGGHADYAPGSPYLDDVVKVANRLHRVTAPDLPELRAADQRWSAWAGADDAGLLAGDSLLHTDFAGHNVLIGEEGGAWIIDWAWATRGASFIDPACLLIRLIDAGHSAKSAELWAQQCDGWDGADDRAVDVFAAASARMWDDIAKAEPLQWKASMAQSAQKWASFRRGAS